MTGDFWNTYDPARPWGLFDPDSELSFPIEIDDWLSKMATTYASHSVIADSPLECVSDVYVDGVITVRIALAAGARYMQGKKYPFTIRVVGADGQQDDRTLWLKLMPR